MNLNWHNDGAEIRTIGIETGKVASRPQNTDYYFRRGITWSDLTSGRFSARLSPGGFVFDVKGSSAFPDDVPAVLALLNSSFAHFTLSLLNPTVSFQVGDLERLPVPERSSLKLTGLVEEVVALSRRDSYENEKSWEFVIPPNWPDGLSQIAERQAEIGGLTERIDEAVVDLYELSDIDRAAIAREVAETPIVDDVDGEGEVPGADEDNENEDNETPMSRIQLAGMWISYAVGIVMGRFQPGVENGLGRGNFTPDVAERLGRLADTDGVLVLDQGHPDDMATKVLQVLQIMLGEGSAREVISVASGREAESEEELRRYLAGPFFRDHVQRYRKRPVYWLLQSPRKEYGIWLFHERLTADTLYRIRGDQYVGSKLNLLDGQIAELQRNQDAAEGRERRRLEKGIGELEELRDDVQAFADKIDSITGRGYTPHIDDGVLINMARLWELIPSWQAEPKKCWQALERGDYDWAHMAMDYWPERVKEKCKENKSYAIAHGLAE